MATKRRPTDEDDEERPRRKRRQDEDDDEEEDEDDRPPRRRSRGEGDEDDDEDRPSKRRRSRDDDEEDDDEDRPAKRRPSRDEDEDDEEDEDRPRKRRKPRDDEKDEEEDDDDEAPPKKDAKKQDDKPAKPESDDGEAEYAAYQKKKLQTRKEFLAVQAGLNQFNKRLGVFLGCLAGLIGAGVFAALMIKMLAVSSMLYAVYLMIAVVGIVPPLIGMQAATKCRKGPSKINGDAYLGFEAVIGFVIMAMFLIAVGCLFFREDEPQQTPAANAPAPPSVNTELQQTNAILMWCSLAALGLGYAAYMVSFINELLYLQTFAKFMKDKISLNRASAAITHFIKFDFIALPIVGTAGYFLCTTSLGTLGVALTGVLALTWLIFLFKGFMDTKRIIEALSLTITKKLMAEDKPNW